MAKIEFLPTSQIDHPRPLPNFRLAWDMAHAQKRAINYPYTNEASVATSSPLYGEDPKEHAEKVSRAKEAISARAIAEAQKVEDHYYRKVAERDDHYYEVEEQYRGVVVNKSDFSDYIASLGDPSNLKKLRADTAFVTRVWNALGQYSEYVNPTIEFGKVVPTGVMKPRTSYKNRGWVNQEKIDYIDLNFASIVHFVDDYERSVSMKQNGNHFDDGRGDKTTRAIIGFVECIKARLED